MLEFGNVPQEPPRPSAKCTSKGVVEHGTVKQKAPYTVGEIHLAERRPKIV